MRTPIRTPIRTLAAVAVLAAVLTACGGTESESTATEPAATQSPSASPTAEPTKAAATAETSPAGQLVGWDEFEADPAAYADSDVVLYFHADWCSECQATDAALESDGIPAGLTLVEIDYDERTDLRQEYGVTVQHTFVLVDQDGERVDAWTDTTSGAEIADRAA